MADQVVALFPVVASPFQAKYARPYKVISCGANDDYTILIPEIQNAPRLGTNNASRDAVIVRDRFAEYL